MNELSGKNMVPSDQEVVSLGFCPHCHCPDSTVKRTSKVHCSVMREIDGARRRVSVLKIIRYRKCVHCGKNFRTTEESSV